MLAIHDIKATLKLVHFRDWEFFVGKHAAGYYLQIRATTPCNVTGAAMGWSGRKWLLSPHMTRSEIVQTALMAVLAAVEHEAREQFLYRGESIFDPHYDVERLFDLRCSKGALEHRAPGP